MRQRLIRIFTFLGGLYFFLEFVLPAEIGGVRFDAYHDQISNGFVAIGAMAIGLGLINLLVGHGSQIVFKRKGWLNSLALLAGLFLMAFIAALDWAASSDSSSKAQRYFMLRDFALRIEADAKNNGSGTAPAPARNARLAEAAQAALVELASDLEQVDLSSVPQDAPAYSVLVSGRGELLQKLAGAEQLRSELVTAGDPAGDLSANVRFSAVLGEVGVLYGEHLNQLYQYSRVKLAYQFLYDGLFVALGSAMFSLLGFYIASAAYRAFRIRSMESGLMLAAALLVMLGQIPFGLWIWEGLPDVRLWILEVPNSAAFRGVKIGAAVAGLVMAFRMWLSIESDSFTEKEG